MVEVIVDVSYSQLGVFVAGPLKPFNDWTDKHVAQGFAWRPESVSFRTLVEAGSHSVEISVVGYIGSEKQGSESTFLIAQWHKARITAGLVLCGVGARDY